jgi:hypothetical protein
MDGTYPPFCKHQLVVKQYGFYNTRVRKEERYTSGSTANLGEKYDYNRNEYPGAAVDKSGTATACGQYTLYNCSGFRPSHLFYVGGGFNVSLTVELPAL